MTALLRVIGRSEGALRKIVTCRNGYYRQVTLRQKSNKTRITYDINGTPLGSVIGRVKTHILDNVDYPPYLHGSLKGRSIITNAETHLGAVAAVSCDITDFFPSIKEGHVFRVFHRGFHFSKKVSHTLALLLTRESQGENELPQGSPASSHIANLVFFNNEPALVEKLRARGYRYTRYVDDITVSSPVALSNEDKSWIIRRIKEMVVPMGFRLKNKKTKIQNRTSRKTTTGLVVGRKRVKIPREYVQKTFVCIDRLKRQSSSERAKSVATIRGKINYIKNTSPKDAEYLERCLVWALANLPRGHC